MMNEHRHQLMARPLLALALAAMAAGCTASADNSGPPLVRVEQGDLRGTTQDGITRFLNIPYAAAPVGDLRWQAPRPASGWEGERDASAFGPVCAQGSMPSPDGSGRPAPPEMSEDCLSLNIWAPQDQEGPLPVMVWIHGGGFMFGSGREPQYDGAALARKGVVLVTLNYRLGALGFMAHPELTEEAPYHASGNYGILDQIAALEWVKANIAQFGGDPANVTLFGESAGSTSISILQASPLAKGLFAKVIGESTSQFDPAGGLIGKKDMRQAERYGAEFAESLGADSLADLRALTPEQIFSKPAFFWPTERDGYVLPEIVYAIFAEGKQSDVPTLVGSNSDEGATIPMEWVKRDASNAPAYDSIYGETENPLRQSATDAVQWQMRSWADLQARTGTAPSWLYWFDQAWPDRPELGAFHGGEIVYVFNNLDAEPVDWTDADRELADLMSSYWVNFARSGDPNGEGLPQWPRYSPANPELMLLSPAPEAIDTPRVEAQEFLDGYFAGRR